MRVERLEREATLREWSRPRDDMECDDLKVRETNLALNISGCVFRMRH